MNYVMMLQNLGFVQQNMKQLPTTKSKKMVRALFDKKTSEMILKLGKM